MVFSLKKARNAPFTTTKWLQCVSLHNYGTQPIFHLRSFWALFLNPEDKIYSMVESEAAFKIGSSIFPLPWNFNFFMIDILTFQILPLLEILIHMMLYRLWGAISSKIPTRASQADAEICIWKRLKRPIFANLDSLRTPDSSCFWPSKPCQEQWLIQICFLLTSSEFLTFDVFSDKMISVKHSLLKKTPP